MKQAIIVFVVTIAAVIGLYALFSWSSKTAVDNRQETPRENATTTPPSREEGVPVVEDSEEERDTTKTVIGQSVEGNDITAYHFGNGETELLFVGGIHGGYEWNTALVAYELMDYLTDEPAVVPDNVRVTVIPVMNPDGLKKVVGSTGRFSRSDVPTVLADTIVGRFNANNVDLNRNFDCDWNASGTWQNRTVSGGERAFSEPESEAVRDYVAANEPSAVVVWYSAAGGVFASSCHNGVLPETQTLTELYAEASGYPAYQEFDFYEITGDMVNWLASQDIPAISVLLTTHQDIEWNKNKAGIDAILKSYAR